MVSINGFPVDIFVTEEHTYDAEITDDPVEEGADVTRNIRSKPAMVVLEGVVTDSPLGEIALDPSRTGSSSPTSDGYAAMIAIRDGAEPVRITTALRQYESMGLLNFSVPKSAANGMALRFRATFKQVTIKSNKRSTTRVSIPRASGKTGRGTKPSKHVIDIGTALQERDTSWAKQGGNAMVGAIKGLL